MRRTVKILAWIVGVLVILPLVLASVVLAALNLDPGRALAARLVTRATDGMVVVDGISGRFPDALRVARIEIHDDRGVWLTVDNAALDWSPLGLLWRQAQVERLAADRVTVARLPVSSGGSSGSFQLPVRVDVDSLRVDRLEIGADVAGASAVLAADGSAHLESLHQGAADIALLRVDGTGSYHVAGHMDSANLTATATADEPAHGLIAVLAQLPELGALTIKASVAGPWTGAATQVSVSAGPLRATAQGSVNIDGEAADLDVTASAPAMAPRADLSWRSVKLDAHVHGKFTQPEARGTAEIGGLASSGATVARLSAQLAGDQGRVSLAATAEGVELPGPRPDLLAAEPVKLTADARLDTPDQPVAFTVTHKLLSLTGTAHTGGAIAATAHLDVPDIAPLAAIGGVELHGSAAFDLKATDSTLDADGTLGVSAGIDPVPALIGPAARIGTSLALHGDDVTLSRLTVDGRGVTLAAHGGITGGTIALDWQAGLPDVSLLAPTMLGKIEGAGHIAGKPDDFALQADVTGEIATQGVPSGPVKLTVTAQGLPSAPSGTVAAEGTLDGAPLAINASVQRAPDGAVTFGIERADWKSAHAEGAMALAPHADFPSGKIVFRFDNLGDARQLSGQAVAGSLNGSVDLGMDAGRERARLQIATRGAGLPGTATLGQADLDVSVLDPQSKPQIDGTLSFSGLNASGIGGSGRVQVRGGQAALAIEAQAALQNVGGENLQATSSATLDVPGGKATVAALQATWRGESLRLLNPVRIGFSNGVSFDRIRLGLRTAVLEVAGRVTPTLALTASLRNIGPDIAKILAPTLQAEGSLQADATLAGTLRRPTGNVHLTGSGLRLRSGPGAAMPAVALTATATLAGSLAQLQARASAGRNDITLDGTVPLDPSGAMNLQARGGLDLSVLDRLVAGQGQRVRGQVTLDAAITGALAAPLANGSLTLANSEVQDFAQGAHVSDIQATLQASGDTVRIAHFTGKAGSGTISASGTIGLAGAMPLDLAITARNATPLASDKLTAVLDADLTVTGTLGAPKLGGSTTITRADFRVPERMPSKVVVLNVRRPGAAPPGAGPAAAIGLDLQVTAPGQVFVRGRGVFAELQGRIHVTGTTAAPQPVGKFTLRRGELTILGHTLTFTSGEVGFDGSGKLDPTIDFVATSTNGSTTATMTISGYASAPKIALSSVPELPPDEVLAQLLFQQSAANLNVFELAEAAAALAQMSGVVSSNFDPLNSVRSGLGLDRLSVGGSSTGSGATLQAGRYVAPGIFVGAKQGTSGSGTQATVQIDLLKGLKLETSVGTGGTTSATGAATTTTDPSGTSVGLTYHFDY